MAGLCRAEQVARAANFEVAHGDLEAGAELRIVADGVQALFGDLREDLAAAERQVGIGMAAAAADAPADLMQLGKAELIGVLND